MKACIIQNTAGFQTQNQKFILKVWKETGETIERVFATIPQAKAYVKAIEKQYKTKIPVSI